jgi:hypothetical protein
VAGQQAGHHLDTCSQVSLLRCRLGLKHMYMYVCMDTQQAGVLDLMPLAWHCPADDSTNVLALNVYFSLGSC